MPCLPLPTQIHTAFNMVFDKGFVLAPSEAKMLDSMHSSFPRNVREIDRLSPSLQDTVRKAFAEQHNVQMRIVLGSTLIQFLSTFLVLRRKK